MEKKLYKSSKNKMIDGVCGGIGEYFGIDPTLVRLGFVALCILGGSGLIAYIVALIIVPRAPEGYDPQAAQAGAKAEEAAPKAEDTTADGSSDSDTPTMI